MSDFKVQGRLGLDGSGFFSTLNQARGAVSSFGGMLAGAFSVGAIAAFSKSILDLAGNLNDVSDALNLNVEFLQRFKNSAAKSGGGLGDIEKFLFESSKARQEAVTDPSGKAGQAFSKLGFSSADVSKLNPQQFIEKIIDAFRDGATPQQINALSEIGGRSAKKLVGGFKEGLDMQTAIIEDSLITQLDDIGDKFTSIGTTIKSMFAPALGMIADAIQFVLDKIEQIQSFYGSFLGDLLAGVQGGGGKSFSQMKDEAVAAREQTKEKQKEIAALALQTSKQKRDAKLAEQSASPEFKMEDAFKSKDSSKQSSVYSDSRLSIGGFLGQGGTTSLSSIAQRQLAVAEKSHDTLKKILEKYNSGASLIIPQ
jgi:hypothetical protein